jgi:murein DD-endopeptidase MepM/ murein hydrolase activator NlpD
MDIAPPSDIGGIPIHAPCSGKLISMGWDRNTTETLYPLPLDDGTVIMVPGGVGVFAEIECDNGVDNTFSNGCSDPTMPCQKFLFGHMTPGTLTSSQYPIQGDHVTAGETIGMMGSTGYSSALHVHIEYQVRDAGTDTGFVRVCPMNIFSGCYQ